MIPCNLVGEPISDVEVSNLIDNLTHIDDLYHAGLLTHQQAWMLFGKIIIVNQRHLYWEPVVSRYFHGYRVGRAVFHTVDGVTASGTITAVLDLEEHHTLP